MHVPLTFSRDRRRLIGLSLLVLVSLGGCTSLIVREEDSDSVVTRKVTARVLLGVISLGTSEFFIQIEEEREAESLLIPVTEGFHKYELRIPSSIIVVGNHPGAVAAATNDFVRLGVRVIDSAQLEDLFAKHPVPSEPTLAFDAEVRTIGKMLEVEQIVFIGTTSHAVSIQGMSVEIGDIRWFGKAQSLGKDDVQGSDSAVARLTEWAFGRVWCLQGRWDDLKGCHQLAAGG